MKILHVNEYVSVLVETLGAKSHISVDAALLAAFSGRGVLETHVIEIDWKPVSLIS
jgi:hypothetical protein